MKHLKVLDLFSGPGGWSRDGYDQEEHVRDLASVGGRLMYLDKCAYKSCKRPVEVISLGRPLCEYHYARELEMDEKKFMKEVDE